MQRCPTPLRTHGHFGNPNIHMFIQLTCSWHKICVAGTLWAIVSSTFETKAEPRLRLGTCARGTSPPWTPSRASGRSSTTSRGQVESTLAATTASSRQVTDIDILLVSTFLFPNFTERNWAGLGGLPKQVWRSLGDRVEGPGSPLQGRHWLLLDGDSLHPDWRARGSLQQHRERSRHQRQEEQVPDRGLAQGRTFSRLSSCVSSWLSHLWKLDFCQGIRDENAIRHIGALVKERLGLRISIPFHYHEQEQHSGSKRGSKIGNMSRITVWIRVVKLVLQKICTMIINWFIMEHPYLKFYRAFIHERQ